MMMNEKKNDQIDRLREQYAQDASAEMAAAVDADTATWETDTEAEPMVGISLRLPKSTLDAVREIAQRQKVKPTALIRSWVENALAADSGELDTTPGSLAVLARVVRESVHAELVNAKLAA
jgi:hypothetical protein